MSVTDHQHESHSGPRPPTFRLLTGLIVTLAAVAIFSAFALRQMKQLRDLQEQTIDRNRRDSLQLLRIQNNLNELALAMRDMLNGDEPYGLSAWKSQVERLHADLDDAMRIESNLAPAARDAERQQYVQNSLNQFWLSFDRVFELADAGENTQARNLISTTLQSQQAAITTTVARLLVQNNEVEEAATAHVQAIYNQVERNIYAFVGAVLLAISLTSLYLIQSNRRLFARLSRLSEQRSDLARKLITMQEELFRSISRELHDEFGQILTGMGALLSRVRRHKAAPPFREDLAEVHEIAQSAVDKVRSLSQVLHPSVLDDRGLESALDWYLPVFEKQTGIHIDYVKTGRSPDIPDTVAIHVYRVAQEALNNVARHSGARAATVFLGLEPDRLMLSVQDGGVGVPPEKLISGRSGIGIIAMRERAELMGGEIEFIRPVDGGTIVRLKVPLPDRSSMEGVNHETTDIRSAG